MKAIISSTYDDKYFFFIPLVTWAWNKIGVKTICFLPSSDSDGVVYESNLLKNALIRRTLENKDIHLERHYFSAPSDKQPTYSQCSRLYAACLNLPDDEVLVTGDVDMIVFQKPDYFPGSVFIFGYDLVPNGQYPMCYLVGDVKTWRKLIGNNDGFQKNLDNLLGDINCENMRGNYWAKDQEQIFSMLSRFPEMAVCRNRARPGTQFADKRYDRDDAFLLNRLSLDTIDYHLPRPGYEYQNFQQILSVLKFHYPDENFDWMDKYREEYIKLL